MHELSDDAVFAVLSGVVFTDDSGADPFRVPTKSDLIVQQLVKLNAENRIIARIPGASSVPIL